MRILIVEDDPQIRRVLIRHLHGRLEHIVLAGTAKQALHLLGMLGGQNTFDAVLSDHDLGRGKNGEQLLQEIEALYPKIRRFGMSADYERWDGGANSGLIKDRWDKAGSIDDLLGMLERKS